MVNKKCIGIGRGEAEPHQIKSRWGMARRNGSRALANKVGTGRGEAEAEPYQTKQYDSKKKMPDAQQNI